MSDTAPKHECYRCTRRGPRRFTRDTTGWRCTSASACADRRLRRADLLAGERKIPTRYLPGDAPVSEKPHA
ncbi:hypothetical protein [Nocardia sp. NBC_01327]|uniref:hypothetical protein n=1 Tax=Nocardia sp. NBC_01327 TaxID=2903593 RepID=UPI002E10A060|nr:hypothetical protein OG326_24135 [Nocardia sp. NBC_01327]